MLNSKNLSNGAAMKSKIHFVYRLVLLSGLSLVISACSNTVVTPAGDSFTIVTANYNLNDAYHDAQMEAGNVCRSQQRSLRLLNQSSETLWKQASKPDITPHKYYQVTLTVECE